MNTSRQLNDLIKNVSKSSAINAQILQKRYFMERFLERISHSDYKHKFVIKGGFLISSLVGLSARSTMDIDITAKNLPVNLESVKKAIVEIMNIELDDNVKFSFRGIESIHEGTRYDCYRVSLDIIFDKVRDSIKVDITTGDVITPSEVEFVYETMLDKKKIVLYSYTVETILAEKIETILTRGILNTRMRDFYDCFILNKLYKGSIDKNIFNMAFKATIKKRGSEVVLLKLSTIIEEIKTNADMNKLWRAYVSTFKYANEIGFDETVNIVESYISLI